MDAAAVMGFCNAYNKTGKMKYIDLRESWVRQLRDRSLTRLVKIAGPYNVADFFIMILAKIKYGQFQGELVGVLDDDRDFQ